jgi:hypothetical protein
VSEWWEEKRGRRRRGPSLGHQLTRARARSSIIVEEYKNQIVMTNRY